MCGSSLRCLVFQSALKAGKTVLHSEGSFAQAVIAGTSTRMDRYAEGLYLLRTIALSAPGKYCFRGDNIPMFFAAGIRHGGLPGKASTTMQSHSKLAASLLIDTATRNLTG